MTKLMAKETTHTWMERSTQENGKKINSMDKELKLGRTAHVTLEITNMERNMEKESLTGLMDQNTMASFSIITFMAKESTFGLTIELTMVIGSTIKWREKVLLLGKTVGIMKVSIETTKRKVTESSNGLMVDATKDFGKMENNTVKVPMLSLIHISEPTRPY